MIYLYTNRLSTTQKDQLLTLWNKEYPKTLNYNSIKEFEVYLSELKDLNHIILIENNTITAWYFDFLRDGVRWFGMIVDSMIQGKGIGSNLLDLAKEKRTKLNGWVIDHKREVKANGEPYISPLEFYIKNGFTTITDNRLENEKLSVVKVVWKRNFLISCKELNSIIEDKDLIILNATINEVGTDPEKEENFQIKGTRFFDLKNEFCDVNSDFPNTIPKTNQFEENCRKLGINNDSKIVIYDELGVYSSPRAWFLFKLFGYYNLKVLNGGFPAWKKENLPTELKEEKSYSNGNFKAKFNKNLVKDFDFILKENSNSNYKIIDARSEGRFNNTTPDPRKELRSGSIPNSCNLPHASITENGFFKSKEELKSIFSKLQIEDKKLIFTCGSGITACILYLATELINENEKYLYDGSWTEWATKTNS